MPKQRTLPQVLEDLDQANSDLANYQDNIPADSLTLAALETAVKHLSEIAQEAIDASNAEEEDDEDDEDMDDSDEG